MQNLLYPRNLPQPSCPSPDLQKDQACNRSRFYALNIRGAYSASCSALCPVAATTHPWRSHEKDVMHRCGSLHTGSSQNSKPSSQPTSVVTVQSLSHLLLFATLWTAACQVSLSFTTAQSFLKLMSINSVMPPSYLNPLTPTSPPALNLSQHQGLFQWVSSLHQVAKGLEL